MSLSWFLWLYHFYALFTAYLLCKLPIYIYIYIYTFSLLLITLEVSRKSLICWCWVWSVICLIVYPESSLINLVNSSSADFWVYSVDQCNQNQVKGIFGVSFLLIVLFVFFLILTFVLQRVTLKQFLLVPQSPLQSADEIWLSNVKHFLGRSLPTKVPRVIFNTFLELFAVW